MEPVEQSHLHLRYALPKYEENDLLFVDDVPKGGNCNCVCPYCRVDLIARQGRKREHHFAHKNNKRCTGARMTALHMLAQKVLVEMKQVMLPEYKGEYYHHDAELKTFDRITKEEICRHEDSTRRPDCIGYNESTGASIWIEIYCRHKIDETKKAEIRQHQQYCIEIDFSDLLNTNYSKETVKNRLLDVSHREWICCPVWDREEERMREAAMKKKERMQANIDLPVIPPIQKDTTQESIISASTKDSTTTSEKPNETEEQRNMRKYWEYIHKLPPSDKFLQQHSPKI